MTTIADGVKSIHLEVWILNSGWIRNTYAAERGTAGRMVWMHCQNGRRPGTQHHSNPPKLARLNPLHRFSTVSIRLCWIDWFHSRSTVAFIRIFRLSRLKNRNATEWFEAQSSLWISSSVNSNLTSVKSEESIGSSRLESTPTCSSKYGSGRRGPDRLIDFGQKRLYAIKTRLLYFQLPDIWFISDSLHFSDILFWLFTIAVR